MALALLGAFAAAVCYGAAAVLQAIAAQRAARRTSALDPRLLLRLFGQLPYLAGTALDLVGFGASALALRTLPLFLVQSVVASNVGVTALLARRVLNARLRPVENIALVGLGAGLTLLAVSAHVGRPVAAPASAGWALLGFAVPLAAAAAALSRAPLQRVAPALAALAGLGFGAAGIAARVLPAPHPLAAIVGEPALWALVVHGVLATLLYVAALQRGSVTTVTAVTVTVETVLPAALGLALLGDAPRPGFAAVAALGFGLALAGALALSRFAEPAASDRGPLPA